MSQIYSDPSRAKCNICDLQKDADVHLTGEECARQTARLAARRLAHVTRTDHESCPVLHHEYAPPVSGDPPRVIRLIVAAAHPARSAASQAGWINEIRKEARRAIYPARVVMGLPDGPIDLSTSRRERTNEHADLQRYIESE